MRLLSDVCNLVSTGLSQTPPGGHHAALANLGVPLTETTLATDTPRRGPMSVE